MATHNDFGKKAEQQAVEYLIQQGYTILEQNYHYRSAEIDVIAKKEDILAIVEVKARSSRQYGEPEAFVSAKKIQLLAEAANQYVTQKDLEVEVRFDIIAIVNNSYEYDLNHIEDAFYPF